MGNKRLVFVMSIILFLGFQVNGQENLTNPAEGWIQLLGNDHDKFWEVFIGAPHSSVKDLAGVDPNSDGMNTKPLGLNNDPKHVFSFEKSADEVILHISGEIYGALSSKSEYEDYHLKLQMKWGEKTWEPRLGKPSDSGILYHCAGVQGAFWNAWMEAQEFQVIQGGCGEFYSMGRLLIDIPSEVTMEGNDFEYKKGAELRNFSLLHGTPRNHCRNAFNNEKPNGEWNTLELICLADTCLQIVNGKVVMALFNPKMKNEKGEIVSHKKGTIQIQSEGAEVFYKNIKIKQINSIPEIFKGQY